MPTTWRTVEPGSLLPGTRLSVILKITAMRSAMSADRIHKINPTLNTNMKRLACALLAIVWLTLAAPVFAKETALNKQSSEELEQWLENLKPEDFGKLDS